MEKKNLPIFCGYISKQYYTYPSTRHFEIIQVRELELNKKYKILRLHTFERTGRNVGKIGVSILLDGFQVELPHRFKEIADFIKQKKPENVFLSYVGRGPRNAYIIHFYDEDKLIEFNSK